MTPGDRRALAECGLLEEAEWCPACETNPAALERALEQARALPRRWLRIAKGFPADSVTRKLLKACAKELAVALQGKVDAEVES